MEKTIRIGIFGLQRGASYINNILRNNGEIVAVCDKQQKHLDAAMKKLGGTAQGFTDFDEFIKVPMDCVFLANYFHEHTPYAIKCFERNIHVLSECTAASTLAECVALVRAKEKSKSIYMLAENYPYLLFNQEMKRIFDTGTMGRLMFAEGEYNHPVDTSDPKCLLNLKDSVNHWRCLLPQSYYITHSLAPLCYITGAMPKRVSAYAINLPKEEGTYSLKRSGDRTAIITTQNNDNSVFRVTGCASFGVHENSYRICATKGQMENVRGTNKVMVHYNEWQVPEGTEQRRFYEPELHDKDSEFIRQAGHGGGDFFVIRKFFECIRQGKEHKFDVYFSTNLSAVAILAHRSILNGNIPYDVPDFRKEEDRVRYENDNLSPFYYEDGTTPTLPSGSDTDFVLDPKLVDLYERLRAEADGNGADDNYAELIKID